MFLGTKAETRGRKKTGQSRSAQERPKASTASQAPSNQESTQPKVMSAVLPWLIT